MYDLDAVSEPRDFQPEEERRRWLDFIAWDGALPLAVALFPLLVDTCFPGNPLLIAVAGGLMPFLATLYRAHIGAEQIRRVCDGKCPLNLQLALTLAILLMWPFETSVAVLTFTSNPPIALWLIPVGFYAAYLAAAGAAFRTFRPKANASNRDEWNW